MDEGDGALDVRLLQVRVVGRELGGHQKALVGQRRVRDRGDAERLLGNPAGGRGELDAAADDRELAPERARAHVAAAADDELADHRLALAGERADGVGADRHGAPAERALALLDRDPHHQLLAAQAQGGLARQEGLGDGVVAGRRQGERELLPGPAAEEAVGQLQHQPGAVSGVRVGTGRAAVLHAEQRLEPLLDDLVRAAAVDPCDEPDAAGVVLESRVVERVLGLHPTPFAGSVGWLDAADGRGDGRVGWGRSEGAM